MIFHLSASRPCSLAVRTSGFEVTKNSLRTLVQIQAGPTFCFFSIFSLRETLLFFTSSSALSQSAFQIFLLYKLGRSTLEFGLDFEAKEFVKSKWKRLSVVEVVDNSWNSVFLFIRNRYGIFDEFNGNISIEFICFVDLEIFGLIALP